MDIPCSHRVHFGVSFFIKNNSNNDIILLNILDASYACHTIQYVLKDLNDKEVSIEILLKLRKAYNQTFVYSIKSLMYFAGFDLTYFSFISPDDVLEYLMNYVIELLYDNFMNSEKISHKSFTIRVGKYTNGKLFTSSCTRTYIFRPRKKEMQKLLDKYNLYFLILILPQNHFQRFQMK